MTRGDAEPARTKLDRPSRAIVTALAVVLSAGFLLRLVPVVLQLISPAHTLEDPDGYAWSGAYVADHPGTWLWLRDVVQFGRYLKAPLYPSVMSALAIVWRGGFPATAAILQVLAATAAGLAVFRIGQRLHSARAGLMATALFMFYWPSFASPKFGQEGLFIPLALATLALHIECFTANLSLRMFALTGVLYTLVALTRSLPLYYLPPLLAHQVFWATDRKRAARQAAVLFATFIIALLPYSFFISAKWGQWVFVDTQGVRAIAETYFTDPGPHGPGMVESLTTIGRTVVANPAHEIVLRLGFARSFFYLRGGQWLQTDAPRLTTEAGATALKALLHLVYDPMSLLVFVGAPLGFVLARDRRVAFMLALWPLISLALMLAFLWSGGRYTASFLPQMMLATGVLLAGGWRKPTTPMLVLALLASAIIAVPVGMSIPLTVWGRADYAVVFRPNAAETRQVGRTTTGEAGFNTFPDKGRIELDLTPVPAAAVATEDGWLEVRVDEVRQRFFRITPNHTENVILPITTKLAFVEVRTLTAAGKPMTAPPNVDIEIIQGRANRLSYIP